MLLFVVTLQSVDALGLLLVDELGHHIYFVFVQLLVHYVHIVIQFLKQLVCRGLQFFYLLFHLLLFFSCQLLLLRRSVFSCRLGFWLKLAE